MDINLNIRLPKAICEMKMATAENTIVARLSISVQIPAGTVSIVIDCCWFSVEAWERDMRTYLETFINQKNTIVEVRIRNTSSEADLRIRAILLEILLL